MELPPGHIIYNQGEVPPAIGLLHSGLVKLVHVDEQGHQIILGLRTSGFFLGLANNFTNSISICTVVTITTCVVSEFDPQDFFVQLVSNASLMQHFIYVTSQEIVTTRHLLTQIMSSSAERRLNLFLEEAAMDSSLWKTIDAAPELKQLEIAQLLSITPEHLSRLMSRNLSSKSSQRAALRENPAPAATRRKLT
jgi:CRP-like cAMP-binding protein